MNENTTPRAAGVAHNRVLLTITQATARCGVCRRTIYNWLARGRIDYTRTPGGGVRIYEDTLYSVLGPRPPGSDP